MPALGVLIKPVSGSCNMRCRYCFYRDMMNKRETACCGIMSEDTLEQLIRQAFAYADTGCTFIFQGGEPTLRGLPFYERLIELVAAYNIRRLPVNYAFQTNGYTIDETWASFFAKHRFLVGLSVDGTKDIHNYFRPDQRDNGTFSAVLRSAACLDRAGVFYNILTVITAQLARHIEQVYSFYKKNRWSYQQYIPCLDPLGEPRGQERFSLTPSDYAAFLKKLFDLWYADLCTDKPVSIRYFDDLLLILKGYPPQSCGMVGQCSCQNVIEADGSVYPCDFYVLDDWKLGNIREQSFAQLHASPRAAAFIAASRPLPQKCRQCPWQALCRNGCRRDRLGISKEESGENYYCAAFQEFLAYASPRLACLASSIPS